MNEDANQQLIAAEHGGRSLVEKLVPKSGSAWKIEATDSFGGRSLMAAARWATLRGASVRVILGSQFTGIAGSMLAESCRRQGLVRPGVARGDRLTADNENVSDDFGASVFTWKMAPTARSLFLRPAAGEKTVLSCAQCREIDKRAVEHYFVPGICLMENAAIASVAMVLEMMQKKITEPVAVVAGGGNNGGDGLAVARGLNFLNIPVEVFLLKPAEHLTGDAAINLDLLRRASGVPVNYIDDNPNRLAGLLAETPLVIDALLGTGFKGGLKPAFRQAIEAMNAADAPKLALDLPSGLNGDTGEVAEAAVRATRTVTFAAVKTGMLQGGAPGCCGEVFLANIGAPLGAIGE